MTIFVLNISNPQHIYLVGDVEEWRDRFLNLELAYSFPFLYVQPFFRICFFDRRVDSATEENII